MNASRAIRSLACIATLFGGLFVCSQAQATMTLTSYATNVRQFTLTTFASGFPNNGPGGIGPLGVAYVYDPVTQKDNVLVSDYVNGNIYVFDSHADNQIASTSLASYGAGHAQAFAQVQNANGFTYYLSDPPGNRIIQVTGLGAFAALIASIPQANALVPFPAGLVGIHTGHLFADDGTAGNIWEIDPVSKTKVLFKAVGGTPDGLAISQDGQTIYVAFFGPGGNVRGYDLATGSLTWTSPATAGGPDGVALGTGTLTGYAYVNYNSGDLWEFSLPPNAPAANLIATGGSRGDWIASDSNAYCAPGHPSLLLTQTDRILRLDPPGGGFFGPPLASTQPVTIGPAPTAGSVSAPATGSLALGALLVCLGGLGWLVIHRSRAVNPATEARGGGSLRDATSSG